MANQKGQMTPQAIAALVILMLLMAVLFNRYDDTDL
jgi:hypothetical protein